MSYSTWMRLAMLCILSVVSTSLYASDTVVLIDQASAAAGNITSGDAPGFPVTLSEPGSYRLASNLVVTDPNLLVIDITTDNVTLDLNGYSIVGPARCKNRVNAPPICPPPGTGTGIQASSNGAGGPRSVKVLNGSVRNMGLHGVQLAGTDSLAQKVASDGNLGSGFIVNGSVLESSATGNGSDGIRALIVRDSMAVQNGDHGLLIDFGGVATGNVVSLNAGRGIFARNGTVIGNTVTRSGNIGVLATCASSIVNNTSLGNVGAPLVTNGDGCVVVNNATSQ